MNHLIVALEGVGFIALVHHTKLVSHSHLEYDKYLSFLLSLSPVLLDSKIKVVLFPQGQKLYRVTQLNYSKKTRATKSRW